MSTDVWVLSYEHLKGLPKPDQALNLLRKIASLVKPIMRKHGWRLPVLAEFFPDNRGLLGMNIGSGQQIFLRLRPAFAVDTFLPEEDIIYTMLHELTHNVHGDHDQNFYGFLSRLEEEYYELKRTGYAGEGFFSNGRRLGAGAPQTVPAWVAQQRALEAAMRRRKANTIPGMGGSVRLGGGDLANLGVTLGLTPRELAVLAADTRAADEKRCASGTLAQEEAEKAARDSHHSDAIDLTGDFDIGEFDFGDDLIILDDERSGSTGPRASNSTNSQPSGSRPGANQHAPPGVNVLTKPRPPPIKRATRPTADSKSQWTCPTCTLINQPLALQCEACLGARPSQTRTQTADPVPTAGWTCNVCGEQGMEHTFWTCRFCGSVKNESTFG